MELRFRYILDVRLKTESYVIEIQDLIQSTFLGQSRQNLYYYLLEYNILHPSQQIGTGTHGVNWAG